MNVSIQNELFKKVIISIFSQTMQKLKVVIFGIFGGCADLKGATVSLH